MTCHRPWSWEPFSGGTDDLVFGPGYCLPFGDSFLDVLGRLLELVIGHCKRHSHLPDGGLGHQPLPGRERFGW